MSSSVGLLVMISFSFCGLFFLKIFLLGIVFFLWVLYRCYTINLSLAMLPMKNMHSYFCFSVTCSFPLAAFKIFFGQFIIYLSVTLCFSDFGFVGLLETVFTKLGNFPAVISSSIFFCPSPQFFSSGTSISCKLDTWSTRISSSIFNALFPFLQFFSFCISFCIVSNAVSSNSQLFYSAMSNLPSIQFSVFFSSEV